MGRPGKKADRLKGRGHDYPLLSQANDASCDVSIPDGFNPADPERSYCQTVSLNHRKQYGQFFTPPPVAELMGCWLEETNPRSILDPAVGTGVLLREVLRRFPTGKATAVDVDPCVLEAARQAVKDSSKVEFLNADFLTWGSPRRFDAVIANPPYLRHHDMLYEEDIFRIIGRRSGVKLSRLTNAYALFILEICRRLEPSGRASILVPGEWANANFGEPIKEFLLRENHLKVLVYYSHASLVFDDSLSTASLVLVERPGKQVSAQSKVRTIYIEDIAPASQLKAALGGEQPKQPSIHVRQFTSEALLSSRKWDYVLCHGVPQMPQGFVPLSDLATTCRGIATGANAYFHLPLLQAQEEGIDAQNLLPCIGRATDAPGLIFTEEDYQNLVLAGKRSHLVSLPMEPTQAEKRYIEKGGARGLPDRYLLSKRTPWYNMESRLPAPIWAAVFGRKSLRFIWNRAGILNLTTFHCVYPKDGAPKLVSAIVACLNSRSVQDMAGQQRRVYGGGLKKFEPKDLLDILLPNVRLVSGETLHSLDEALSRVDEAWRTPGAECDRAWDQLDKVVAEAGEEAAVAMRETCGQEESNRLPVGPLWEQRKHRGAQAR